MAFTNSGAVQMGGQSKTKDGVFSFRYIASNPVTLVWDVAGQFTAHFYATSSVSTAYPRLASQWKSLGSIVCPAKYNGGAFNNVQFQISTASFLDAQSLAVRLSTPTGANTRIEFDPLAIQYYNAYNVLDSGSGIGSFYYFATDGGFK